jgi:2-dehydro-3-deoxyphosphogluconate aldolase/(4S)-4-hydroxy-2-oxoglutarate aldolase
MLLQRTMDRIKADGIIVIIRGNFPLDEVLRIAELLLRKHLTVMEVTLNSPVALEAIPALRRQFGESLLVGAGTVRDLKGVEMALEIGAQFIVSPNFDPASVSRAQAACVLHLPGVATPTEAQAAFTAGCRLLKLFPCDVLGGPAYLKAIRAPLDDLDFVPTGGITPTNLQQYRAAGAVAVGVGGALVNADWSPETLQARAAAFRTAWG